MDRETRLGILASSIIDGTPVDWPAAGSTADESDRGVVRQLQIVAEIAALHRSPEAATTPAPAVEPPTPIPASWGHLRLFEAIGRGTFGQVYRAWDTHLDREVALKLLRTGTHHGDPSASLSDPARVVNEGRLLARVRHPNVVTVYGAETRDSAVGIWMEFIRGRTLHDFVEQQGPLSAKEAVAVGTDLCGALAAVHGAGLLHRDVTARNVMREDGGRVVLMDFGAGHEQQDRLKPSGRDITGTPLYMAPEIFAGAPADHRTDVYAVGVLLYHLVTGRFPVVGRSLTELSSAHASGARTRLRNVRADLPAAFIRAVEQATAANPADRVPTAGDLEAALERAVDDGRATPRPSGMRRWTMMAAAAAVVVIVAGSDWLLRSRTNEPPGSRGSSAATLAQLTTKRLRVPDGVWPFSNPSRDGRYLAGMVTESGDVAVVDLATGDARALHMAKPDGSDGYASLAALSPDGRFVAVDWYNEHDGSLRLIGADGSAARVLVDPPGDVNAYEWSSDGSLILATLGTGEGNVLALVAARDGGVRSLRRLGASVPQHASLSPDSRYVVYDQPAREGATDHDVHVLDAHTGEEWPLDESPGHDVSPFFSPDGRAVVFISDRNRNPSLWMIPVENGRPQGASRLLKDNIGRVLLRGFTQSGALFFQLSAGFAEVYVASIDDPARPPEPISPRQALSNFYPVWSRDGRYIAYASERSLGGRELWVFDTQVGRETRVALPFAINRPYAWSANHQQILVGGPDDGRIYVVERSTGQTTLIASGVQRAPAWGAPGIVFDAGPRMLLHDPAAGRTVRMFDFSSPAIGNVGRPPSLDGRSLIVRYKDGQVALHDTTTGHVQTWQDSGIEWMREHVLSPHTRTVAYVVGRKDLKGSVSTLMVWGGSGNPREILRVQEPSEQLRLVGWTPDELHLLVIRWSFDAARSRRVGNDTLWRVPTNGGAPVSTGLALDGMRDISIHPDGRQVVFNAGFKKVEYWVMENLLSR